MELGKVAAHKGASSTQHAGDKGASSTQETRRAAAGRRQRRWRRRRAGIDRLMCRQCSRGRHSYGCGQSEGYARRRRPVAGVAEAARHRRRRGAALARMLARSRLVRLDLSCNDSIDGDKIRTGANMSFHIRNVWQTNSSVNIVLFSVQIPTFRWYFTCPRSFGGIFRISGSFSATEPIFPKDIGILFSAERLYIT